VTYSFHHVHLVCRDLEQMIDFFVEVIGAKLVKRRKFGTAEGAALDLQGIGINLRIAREGEETRDNLTQSTYGYDHIGLQVEDVQAAYDDLTNRGYYFLTPPTKSVGVLIAFFKGPENITIELMQPLD